jgi:hypothetical protein
MAQISLDAWLRGAWQEDFSLASVPSDWVVLNATSPPNIQNGTLAIEQGATEIEWQIEQFHHHLYYECDLYIPPGVSEDDVTTYRLNIESNYLRITKKAGHVEFYWPTPPGDETLQHRILDVDGGWYHLKMEWASAPSKTETDPTGATYEVPQYSRLKYWKTIEPEDWQIVARPAYTQTVPAYPLFFFENPFSQPLGLDNVLLARDTDPLPSRFSLDAVVVSLPSFGISARILAAGAVETAIWVDDFNAPNLHPSYLVDVDGQPMVLDEGAIRPERTLHQYGSFSEIRGFPSLPAGATCTVEYDIYVSAYPFDWYLVWVVNAGRTQDPTSLKWRLASVVVFPYEEGYQFSVANACWVVKEVTPSTWYSIKAQIPGRLSDPYRIKVWPRNEPEPTTWDRAVTQSGTDIPESPYIWVVPGQYSFPWLDNLVIASDTRSFSLNAFISEPYAFRIQAHVQGDTPTPSASINAIVKATLFSPKPVSVVPYIVYETTGFSSTHITTIPHPPEAQAGDYLVWITMSSPSLSTNRLVSLSPMSRSAEDYFTWASWEQDSWGATDPAFPERTIAASRSSHLLSVSFRQILKDDPLWLEHWYSASVSHRAYTFLVIRGAGSLITGAFTHQLASLASGVIDTTKTLSWTPPISHVLQGSQALMIAAFGGQQTSWWRIANPPDEQMPSVKTVRDNVERISLARAIWHEEVSGTIGPTVATPTEPDFGLGLLLGFVGTSTRFRIGSVITDRRILLSAWIQSTTQTTTHLRTGPHYDQTRADYLYTLTVLGGLPEGTALHEVLVHLDQRITEAEEQR